MAVKQGILPSGGIIAVKKLFSNKTLDERMFEREVTAMMMVEHQNTVRFLGYCSHTEQQALEMWGKYILAEERERLLCFDYISKGSLEDYVTGMKMPHFKAHPSSQTSTLFVSPHIIEVFGTLFLLIGIL